MPKNCKGCVRYLLLTMSQDVQRGLQRCKPFLFTPKNLMYPAVHTAMYPFFAFLLDALPLHEVPWS